MRREKNETKLKPKNEEKIYGVQVILAETHVASYIFFVSIFILFINAKASLKQYIIQAQDANI